MKFRLLKLFKSLLQKSARVQLEIDAEARRKHPDWMRIIMLKKQRLLIKDRLQRLQREMRDRRAERRASRRRKLIRQY